MKKIVITGPESTGKSTLCQQLSQHFKSMCCPEYAREYLLQNGTKYIYDDLLTIAKGQLSIEDEYIQKTQDTSHTLEAKAYSHQSSVISYPILFIDTDMYVMKVWCEYVFGKCHSFILDMIVERKYDLYLLCNIDLMWVKDELREYPNEKPRKELYRMYKDILINQQVPWAEISGNYEQRLQQAIAAVKKYCG
jgi:NadR type nicotinamide-nucleotide adenylyltransferase